MNSNSADGEVQLSSAAHLPGADVPDRILLLTGIDPTLADRLADAFYDAVAHWAEFQPGMPAWPQAYWSVWPDDQISSQAVRSTQLLFQELATTSRFSVNESAGDVAKLEAEIYTQPPLMLRHAVATAALVCLSEAVYSMEEDASNEAEESLSAAEAWLAQCGFLRNVERGVELAMKSGQAEGAAGARAAVSKRNAENASGRRLHPHITDDELAAFIATEQGRRGATYNKIIEAMTAKWPASDKVWKAEYSRLAVAGRVKRMR